MSLVRRNEPALHDEPRDWSRADVLYRTAKRKYGRQDGLRPLEIWLPAAMIEMIDELKRDDLLSREAIIAAIVAQTLSVRPPETSEGQPMML